jgi:hypothetical protein
LRRVSRLQPSISLTSHLMFAGFCAADNEPSTEEFLVVQFPHGAFCFFDRLHLHEGKTFRALVMPVTYDLGVLNMSNTVEQFEEVALGSVERQVADVKARRSDFDRFRFSRRSRWLRTIARCRCRFFGIAVSKKCYDSLPECFLLSFGFFLSRARTAIAPASGPAARTARTSPG